MSAAMQVSVDRWKAAIICTVVEMCRTRSQKVPAVMVGETLAAILIKKQNANKAPFPPELKCGSEPYNPQEKICCSGNLYKKASALTKCCGKDVYTLSDDNVLCCNGILHLNVPEQSECVGGVIYAPPNTICQMSARPRLGEHCCGGQTFNPRTHICCNGHSHNKTNGNYCCGSEVYDLHNQLLRCCSGHLYNLTRLSGEAECCGNHLLEYNNNQICCSSSTNAIIYDTKPNHRCCGHYYYNTSLWSCCAEHLKPTPKPDSSPAEYRLKPLMDLIPEMCNKTVFFGKVESVALENYQRHIVLKVVGQVDVISEKIIKDPWLHVSLDHCSSPATENGMTYLWEENHDRKYKLLSHHVDLTSDMHMFYAESTKTHSNAKISEKKKDKQNEETDDQIKTVGNDTGEPRLIGVAGSAAPPSNQDNMDAITALNASFNQKFDTFTKTVTELRITLTDFAERVTTIEEATTNQETRLTNVEKQCVELMEEWRCVDRETIVQERLSSGYIIYQTKELIMKLAREKPLEYKGKRVHIFPDLTADVLKQRYHFSEIKKKCKNLGIKYGFQFPFTFIVTAKEGETKTFDTPEDNEAYLRRVVDNWAVD
ncbi:hypothetical protein cypCar_00035476 [Cyprinus carpio]|nr:hypothetical protein cypCar_00035476 [Cyprinus carpio]